MHTGGKGIDSDWKKNCSYLLIVGLLLSILPPRDYKAIRIGLYSQTLSSNWLWLVFTWWNWLTLSCIRNSSKGRSKEAITKGEESEATNVFCGRKGDGSRNSNSNPRGRGRPKGESARVISCFYQSSFISWSCSSSFRVLFIESSSSCPFWNLFFWTVVSLSIYCLRRSPSPCLVGVNVYINNRSFSFSWQRKAFLFLSIKYFHFKLEASSLLIKLVSQFHKPRKLAEYFV